jgi:hypothetical protein
MSAIDNEKATLLYRGRGFFCSEACIKMERAMNRRKFASGQINRPKQKVGTDILGIASCDPVSRGFHQGHLLNQKRKSVDTKSLTTLAIN